MNNIPTYIKGSGYSMDDISNKANITQQRLEYILQGSVEPNMGEIRKLSKILKVPLDLLISENDNLEEVRILFRQGNVVSKRRQIDKISYSISNALSLLNNYKVDKDLFDFFRPSENSFANARLLAAKFRVGFCKADFLSPLVELPRIVSEELGCIMFIMEIDNYTDGASAIIDNIPFIFISPRFEPRMLFTLAHELAHVFSHLYTGVNYAKVDNKIAINSSSKFKDETFANAFASELLMPEEGVGATLVNLRKYSKNKGAVGDIEIIHLSRIYGVSFDVAAKRCEDLNLIPTGGAVSISDQIKKEYGSAEKRAASLKMEPRSKIYFPKVSSTLLDNAIKKINDGELSIEQASEMLSISVSDLIHLNSKDR